VAEGNPGKVVEMSVDYHLYATTAILKVIIWQNSKQCQSSSRSIILL